MATGTCEKPECTIATTGTCLLHGDSAQCPHFEAGATAETAEPSAAAPPAAVPEPAAPPPKKIHSGNELGTDEALEISAARYVHLIPILGVTDVGKTCFLSSLYLLLSSGLLRPRYLFAGSLTIKGFDERARRLRRWAGGALPEKLAEHTESSDPRSPSLMHMALVDTYDNARRYDLLMTDLPGEWTQTLIEREDTAERFGFLHRADGVIIVIDGPSLDAPATRHIALRDAKLLVARLNESIRLDRRVPIVLLISKCDKLAMRSPDAVEQLVAYVQEDGRRATAVLCAAFSETPEEIENGTGVMAAIKEILDHQVRQTSAITRRAADGEDRAFLRFRI